MRYEDFLKTKKILVQSVGKEIDPASVDSFLKPFQRDLVVWAARKGRAALFANTGMGKTVMHLEWARLMDVRTLMIAPLSVARQTVKEAQKRLGLDVRYVRSGESVVGDHKLWITSPHHLDKFDAGKFGAVVLDESSILKSFSGALKMKLIEKFKDTPYRLCCTATPAPNDIVELGNHAEFLGVMTSQQMTSIFFVHEAGVFQGEKTSRWRLKGHAKQDFYRWLASWSIAINKPSDLGYDNEGYDLPELSVELILVDSDYTPEGMLPGFHAGNVSAVEAKRVRKQTIDSRAEKAAELVNGNSEQWLIWRKLLDEADTLKKLIPDSIDVRGSLDPEIKADLLEDFTEQRARVLITESSIAGFGMNMQQASNMIFFGIDFSFEGYYQCVRRMWRYGQQNPVKVYVIISKQEQAVFDSVLRKEKEAQEMTIELIQAAQEFTLEELGKLYRNEFQYLTDDRAGASWHLMLGDSCKRMAEIADDSVGLSVYSPPFPELYVYNHTEMDLSNSFNIAEFMEHYSYIIRENLRITMPGRIAAVHVQDIKAFKGKDGYRGLKDWSGMVIQAYVEAGWIYRSTVTIDKNPQIVASRNKDSDLLFVTGKRDSTGLAPCPPDYLLIFRKPGDNPIPVTPYANGEMNEQEWITWAHPIWYDISETDVLNVRQSKDKPDEKHMCPLQLPLIERAIRLWSNPQETVFSPFAGIGSEIYEAVRLNRFGLGIELKPSYFNAALKNIAVAEISKTQLTLL